MSAKLWLIGTASLAYASLSAAAHAIPFISIGGTSLATSPAPLYGDQIYQNNVINSPGAPSTGSLLNDPSGPLRTAATPWVQNGQVKTILGDYRVDWYFVGAESGLVNTFTATGNASPILIVTFTENNQNNSAYSGGPPAVGPGAFIGSTYGSSAIIPFSISWAPTADNPGGSVDNSAPQASPGSGSANMIFSFLDITSPTCSLTTVAACNITNDPSKSGDIFIFALNDSGSTDDNHDDFVGLGLVTFIPDRIGFFPTPIPGALPLLSGGLGALGLVGWKRRRTRVR